jgi:peptidoglycan/xylan/chitin deacetylase (PgdA/CDA1 family)
MSLDPAYLTYPRRAQGMDHDLYRWSNLFDRAPIVWPGDVKLAVSVVISLEWFPITPSDKPFRAPGHMQTAYPDYRHYTSREYGTRIGFYRMLDALAAVGAKASVAVNSAIAERYPALLRDIVAAGHEVVAHATDMNATIATGLAEEEERAIIHTSLDMLEKAIGKRPTGWLSIARSQSWNTPRLLAEEGVGYMLDWVNDELPYRMTTPAGGIVNVPLNHELSDRQIITTQQHSADSYRVQIEDAADWLMTEALSHGGRMLPLHITPYIMGLPYRIGALETLLKGLASREGLAFLSTGAIAAGI